LHGLTQRLSVFPSPLFKRPEMSYYYIPRPPVPYTVYVPQQCYTAEQRLAPQPPEIYYQPPPQEYTYKPPPEKRVYQPHLRHAYTSLQLRRTSTNLHGRSTCISVLSREFRICPQEMPAYSESLGFQAAVRVTLSHSSLAGVALQKQGLTHASQASL
jgi:hypothetical protein